MLPGNIMDSSQNLQLSLEFSDEQLIALCEAADVIACECPSYLVRLLHEVREFRRYTGECIENFPEDTATHIWLSNRAAQVEMLLSVTIWEFLQKENLLDHQNKLNLDRLSERSRKLAVTKVLY